MTFRAIVTGLLLVLFALSVSSAIEVDVSLYDSIKQEDVRLASIGVDYFNVGEFQKAVEHFKQAIELAEGRKASGFYIDDLKIKLGSTLINLERYDEGQAVLKEVYGKGKAKDKKEGSE